MSPGVSRRAEDAASGRARLAALVRTKVNLTAMTWAWLMVGLGVVLRILEYTDGRALYMDELSLIKNLVGHAIFDFETTLTEDQLAPPGFLALERLMVWLPLPATSAARLVPMLCGIASMFLMRSVALRYLTSRAVPIAVGLFALNDWILYYSSEAKQYSSDVALALVAFLLAAGPDATAHARLRLLTGFGAVGVWFSHPLALVLAGLGSFSIARAAIGREWKKALCCVAMSLAWALSFALCYKVSHQILSKDPFIWTWWAFAFLPLPRSLGDLQRDCWQILNLLNSPSCIVTPLGVLPSVFLALGLFVLGGVALMRRWPGGLYVLVSPIVFAILASTLRQYPFHGRLLLFLVPSVHLVVSEGAAVLASSGGAKLTFVVGALLLYLPALDVLSHRFILSRGHVAADSHGDLSPDLLDYLEHLERKTSRPRRAP
jgi:hypothetical protein